MPGFYSALLLLPLLAFSAAEVSAADDWDYKDRGPAEWARLFPQFCAGVKQSPVALDWQISSQEDSIKAFVVSQWANASEFKLTLKNDGHKVQLNWSPQLTIKMDLGTSDQMYTAAQLHWHWGADDAKGSEHTMDGRSYPAEGHLVFYNSKDYASLAEAANRPNGLAVLGVFYEASETENPFLSLIDRALANDSLVPAGGFAELTVARDSFDLVNSFLPSSNDEFYRYEGSLTTPNCYESVLWTVYRRVVPISARQLGLLRRLKFTDNSPMVDNYRPPLPLNPGHRGAAPRTLYRTFSSADVGHSRLARATLVMAVVLPMLLLRSIVA